MNFMLEAKLMDFHLDALLNLPDITIEKCIKNDIAFLRKMRYDVTDLNEVKNIEPENVMQL